MTTATDDPPRAWTMPTLGDLLRLAWPVVIGRAAQSVVGFSDAALVADLGPDALAATSNGSLNALAVMMLPTGLVFIVQSFASQLHGAGDRAGVRRYGWYGLAVAGLTQLLAVAVLPLLPWALGRLDYSAEVRELMTAFLAIRLLGAGAAVGIEALSNWFSGQERTGPGSIANVTLMVLNVPLNLWLIHGGLGVPALGVRGSALASVVATWLAFLLLLVLFWREGRGAERPGWRWAELARMVRFGLPSGVNWLLEFAAFLFFIDVVFARLGTVALAALMAVLQLNTVAFMPAFGVASAGAIQVGNALGARQHDRVGLLVQRATLVACGWMLLVGLGYSLMPRPLLGIFARGAGVEAEVMVSLGARLLLVSIGWQLFDGLTMTLAESLRAAGDTAWPMWARIGISWFLFVPATLLTVRSGGGPVAALSWTIAYMALLSVLLFARFRSGHWRRIALTAPTS